jgi:hypothetical protein
MNQHPGGLHNHDYQIILELYFERNVFRRHRRGSAVVERGFDKITGGEAITRAAHVSVHQTRARFDEIGDTHAAQVSEARRTELIDATSGVAFVDLKLRSLAHLIT